MSAGAANHRPGLTLAVVVGAGAMGTAIARRLGASHRLLVADRDGDHLEQQIAALRSEGHDADGVVCDIVDRLAVEKLAAAAGASAPLRAVAHVVGLSPSMAEGERVLEVNLIGPTLVADAFLGLARPGTAALFVASLAGHQPDITPELAAALSDPLSPDFVDRVKQAIRTDITPVVAYQLSKWALINMCQQRAWDWAERGARIVSVSPGPIATPMGTLELERQPEKVELLKRMPMPREGTVIEVADAVEFLLSDRASFITGTDLLVDGGAAALVRSRTHGAAPPKRG